jgi:putative ABC transport system permease protein
MRPEHWIYTIPLKLRSLFRRRQTDHDLDAELRDHLAQKTEAYIAGGMTPHEAHRQALIDLRGLERTRQECKDVMPLRWLDHLARDFRFGLRMLAKSPGFATIAVVALALGIGIDTAMYSIVNGALSWNMDLDNRDSIVAISSMNSGRTQDWGTSYPDFQYFRSHVKSLAGLAAYRIDPVNLSDRQGLPDRFDCAEMSANGFSVVGQKPMLGRDFIPADERPGARPVVMLGYHVWRDRYGLNPAIVGETITINEIPHTVIGVMPAGRRFPEETDLWTALLPDAARDNRNLILFGKLRKAVPLASVRAEITSVAGNLAAEYPNTNKNITAVVVPIMQLTGLYFMEPVILALFVAVGLVLLIACADVANMLLARATERSREISIRVAIGAGKVSVLRQLLIESVMLSAAGGMLAWPVAVGGLRWFDSGTSVLTTKPVWLHLTLDRSAFLYLAAISIGTGILFGLAPALRLAKTDVNLVLKEGGGSGVVGSMSSLRLSNVLVAAQMALCVVLLVDAGVLIRSAAKMYATPIGVNTKNVLTMRVDLRQAKYTNASSWIAFQSLLARHLSAIPGVQLAGTASNLPMGGWVPFGIAFDGSIDDPAHRPEAGGLIVSDNYFAIMQVQPLRGRLFSEIDGESGTSVAIVNQSFVKKFWPSVDPLGKRVAIIEDHPPASWFTVVGIVPDVLQNFRENLEHDPLIYLPFSEMPQHQTFLIARTSVSPSTLADSFRREVQQIDPGLPLYDIRTLDNRIAETRLSTSLFGAMCSVFAGIATILAAIGLYAVIAHAVTRRTREIGLRIALGASRADVMKLVVGQCIRPLLPGMTLGLLLALGGTQVLRNALQGVSPNDPATFVGTVIVLVFAAFVGCAVPARRAMKVDPMVALRYE